MASLEFFGEQIAGYSVEDLCPFEKDTQYIIYMSDCGKRKLKTLDQYLTKIQGYDGTTTQTLQHNNSGKILRA